MKYAQIVNNKVFGIFEYDTLPEFSSKIVMVEVDDTVKAGYSYVDSVFEAPSSSSYAIVPITLTSMTGNILPSIDLSSAVVQELLTFTITADIPLGVDQTFLMPIRRLDTGRTVYSEANVINNVFTTTLALPSAGRWVTGEAELNADLEGQPFRFSFSGLTVTALQ